MNRGGALRPVSHADDLMRLLAYAVFLIANLAILDTVSGALQIDSLTALALSVLFTFVVILLHELGHAIAIWRLRGRVLAIAVGPVTAHFDPFRLRVTEDTEAQEVGGFVIGTFDGWETTRKDLIVSLAGPAANLLLAAAAAGAALSMTPAPVRIPARPAVVAASPADTGKPFFVALPSNEAIARIQAAKRTREIWIPLLHALAILSAAAGIANLIPFRGSDGAEVWSIVRERRVARRRNRPD